MEDWSRSEFLALEAFVLAFYSFLCALVGIRVAIKIATNGTSLFKHSLRYTFYVWILGVMCITTMFGVWMVVKPFQTEASKNTVERLQSVSCPCPEEAKINNHPSPAVQASVPKAVPSPNKTDNLTSVSILANNINKIYSRNALMGGFEGTLRREADEIIFHFPNPKIYLAGDSDRMGNREIFSVEIAVGDHEELYEISKTSKVRGNAYWSELVPLKDVVRYNGQESHTNQPVEVSVRIPSTVNLTNKAFLIKMHNRFVGSGKEIFPGYVLSANHVFSRH